MARIAWQALGLSVGLSWFVATQGTAALDKDLDGLKKKIEREKQGISRVRKTEGSILQSLEKIEVELSKRAKALTKLQSRLNSVLVDMERKEAEEKAVRASIGEQEALLRHRVAALYRWYKGGNPSVILNGETALGVVLQRKRYLEATVAFDRALIQQLSEEARRHNMLRIDLARKREELDEQKQALEEARRGYRQEGDKKKQLLASLRQEKALRVKALKELEQAALRLQKMLDEISRRSMGKSRDAAPGDKLEAMKGKFDWPVKGELAGVFGRTRHPEFPAEVFRQGIDIGARTGEQIKAVEKGKVVFADRFAGYGNMIIIDHGDRFFTIYAHLLEIIKKNGDVVKRGETVGLVGDSDSLAGAKLYFEMRKDGRPIDPLPWLRKQ